MIYSIPDSTLRFLRHSKIDYINVASYILIAIIFANLNGILSTMFGITAGLSPIILLCSLAISIPLFLKNYEKETLFLWAFVGFQFMYCYISSISYFLNEDNIFKNNDNNGYLLVLKGYISTIIIIFTFYKLTTVAILSGKFANLIKRIFFFFLVGLAFIVLMPLLGIESIGIDKDRSGGLFESPNVAASFTLYATCFTLFFAARKQKWAFLNLILVPFLGYAAFLTFSKAAMITFPLLIFMFLGFLIVKSKYIKKQNYPTIGTIILVVAGIIIYVISNFQSIYESLDYSQVLRIQKTLALLSGEVNENTTSERSGLFRIGFQLISERPILGNGMTSFHYFNIPLNGHNVGVHNTFLMVFGEAGVFVFLFYIIIFVASVIRALRLRSLSLSFLFVSLSFVYFLNMGGASHNGLDDRITNCWTGIMLGVFAFEKKLIADGY